MKYAILATCLLITPLATVLLLSHFCFNDNVEMSKAQCLDEYPLSERVLEDAASISRNVDNSRLSIKTAISSEELHTLLMEKGWQKKGPAYTNSDQSFQYWLIQDGDTIYIDAEAKLSGIK